MLKERGSTMVEMMGVLAVMGILATGVWKLIDSAIYKYKISEVTLQIQALAKNISRFYASVGNYDALNETDITQKLFQNRVVPHDMQAGDTNIRHSFRGEVTLAGHGENFSVVFKNLVPKVCMELATLAWQKSDRANLVFIKIGQDEYGWPVYKNALGEESAEEEHEDLTTTERYLPISMTEAIDSCKSSDGNLVDIEWMFR